MVVTNTPNVLTETTAELGFTLMLRYSTSCEAEKYVEADAWQSWGPYLLSGKDVFNSTVGIYGMGDIGKAFARRLQGLILKFFIIIDQDIKMQRRTLMQHICFF